MASAGAVSLNYDAVGRLKQVVGAATTRFDYAGDALIAELDASNAVQRRYVPGPGTDEPIVWYEGSGLTNRRWFHADERGSIVTASDASGTALFINSYDEYGIPAITNQGRFEYTGQTYLPEIGLYYYKARIYSPTFGRFLQTDPIGYGDGMNMYAYVRNNPINATDTTGTTCYNDTGLEGYQPVICNSFSIGEWNQAREAFARPDLHAVGPNNLFFPALNDNAVALSVPQRGTQPVLCANNTGRVVKGRTTLPSAVTASKIWNDPAALKFYQLTYRDNANDYYLAGKAAAVGGVALAFTPMGKAASVGSAVAGVAVGEIFSAQQAKYEGWDNTIQARLDQIAAQKEGSCP